MPAPQRQQLTQQEARPLFFSGGTALNSTAKELARRTSQATYLVTPFDSGGSSSTLRKHFGIPAVGDLRARLAALADMSAPGTAEAATFFSYRFPAQEDTKTLQGELGHMVQGRHPLLCQVPTPMREIMQEHLTWFAMRMPHNFPLQRASIGNLLLTAGYILHSRRLSPVIALYSHILKARGIVRPIIESPPAHLAVRLTSGKIIVGQHLFTGKEASAINSPIQRMWLTPSLESSAPVDISISQHVTKRIRAAQSIVYPIGSFYSSVLANLLPKGVGKAIASTPCPKLFIPNLGTDPELFGQSLQTQVNTLVQTLLSDSPGSKPSDILTTILIDNEHCGQPSNTLDTAWCEQQGIHIIDTQLVTKGSAPLADPQLLADAILTYTLLDHSTYPHSTYPH